MTRKQPWLVTFVFGMAVMWCLLTLKSTFGWHTVQVLRHPSANNVAMLERVDSIDTNFRVSLNGTTIYHSPDFSPQKSFPFREALLWDDSANFLIFEVAGRRLFGYDLTQNKQLTDAQLLSVKTSPVPIRKYGFGGRWPQDIAGQ